MHDGRSFFANLDDNNQHQLTELFHLSDKINLNLIKGNLVYANKTYNIALFAFNLLRVRVRTNVVAGPPAQYKLE